MKFSSLLFVLVLSACGLQGDGAANHAIDEQTTAGRPVGPTPTSTPRPATSPTPSNTTTPTPSPTPTQTTLTSTLATRFIGRVDLSAPETPKFAWPLTTAVAKFSGTSIGMDLQVLSPTSNLPVSDTFDVSIDGANPAAVTTSPTQQSYILAQNLSSGTHTVRVIKRSESRVSYVEWHGFTTSDPDVTTVPLAPSPRGIEFVGDSITAGYGAEGDTPNDAVCANNFGEDADLAYPAITARTLGADYSVIAWAGIGVLNTVNGGDTAQSIFERTLAYNAQSVWDFSWTPQAVVVNLGSNDNVLATQDPAGFRAAYEAMIREIRGCYPTTHIFCVTGPMLHGADLTVIGQGINDAVAVLQASGDSAIHSVTFAPDDGSRGLGCYDHPTAATHVLLAQQLSQAIAQVMQW